jgi:hypothetical protein
MHNAGGELPRIHLPRTQVNKHRVTRSPRPKVAESSKIHRHFIVSFYHANHRESHWFRKGMIHEGPARLGVAVASRRGTYIAVRG